jgi:EAL domain-containing protein (putative c-di-GMP-specific phosphodiesterase class I)
MHYLEGLPVDMVKIHPTLIRDLADKPKTRGVVKNLTEMLHGFHLEVAAKSVEDPQSLEMLRELGIDYAQGFAIDRPLESIEQVSEAPRVVQA